VTAVNVPIQPDAIDRRSLGALQADGRITSVVGHRAPHAQAAGSAACCCADLVRADRMLRDHGRNGLRRARGGH